ncbi:hypothetical protein HBB16_06570 [Pseudonocardia sp. MCCB 268]|nr:hypothetical protein [Pseudonocardia cytotoxica]
MGLLERENATIINACLRELAEHICDGLAASLAGEEVPLRALPPARTTARSWTMSTPGSTPVATFASGPTSSTMRGAAFRSPGLDTCAVVDVGGYRRRHPYGSFPRHRRGEGVGGVRTNFRMPDVLSVSISGGSRIQCDGDDVMVRPDGVGFRLRQEDTDLRWVHAHGGDSWPWPPG